MIPQAGQQVKCIFRNGASAEGIVEHWDTQAQLRSFDGESILIITKPAEDIMMIKITLDKDLEVSETSEIPQMELPFESLALKQEEAEMVFEPESAVNPFDDDYNKSLVDLRKELAHEERRILANKLREHRPSIAGVKIKYEQPRFDKKPSTK